MRLWTPTSIQHSSCGSQFALDRSASCALQSHHGSSRKPAHSGPHAAQRITSPGQRDCFREFAHRGRFICVLSHDPLCALASRLAKGAAASRCHSGSGRVPAPRVREPIEGASCQVSIPPRRERPGRARETTRPLIQRLWRFIAESSALDSGLFLRHFPPPRARTRVVGVERRCTASTHVDRIAAATTVRASP